MSNWTIPDPAKFDPPLPYAEDWPTRISTPWWFFNPFTFCSTAIQIVQFYLEVSIPAIFHLWIIFFVFFIALLFLYARYPDIHKIILGVMLVASVGANFYYLIQFFQEGLTLDEFWDRTYGIGDLTEPFRVYLMGPLYLFDYLDMLVIVVLLAIVNSDFILIPSLLFGGAFSLPFGIFRAQNCLKEKSIWKSAFWFLYLQVIIMFWVPYQLQYVQSGLGEGGRLQQGLLNKEIAYPTTQVLIAYFIILPEVGNFLFFQTTLFQTILGKIFASVVFSTFSFLYFAHIAGAATFWLCFISLKPFTLKTEVKKKTD